MKEKIGAIQRKQASRSERWYGKQAKQIEHDIEFAKPLREIQEHIAAAVDLAKQNGLTKDLRQIVREYMTKDEEEDQ